MTTNKPESFTTGSETFLYGRGINSDLNQHIPFGECEIGVSKAKQEIFDYIKDQIILLIKGKLSDSHKVNQVYEIVLNRLKDKKPFKCSELKGFEFTYPLNAVCAIKGIMVHAPDLELIALQVTKDIMQNTKNVFEDFAARRELALYLQINV